MNRLPKPDIHYLMRHHASKHNEVNSLENHIDIVMLKVGYFLYGIHMQGYLSSRTSTCTCIPNDNI